MCSNKSDIFDEAIIKLNTAFESYLLKRSDFSKCKQYFKEILQMKKDEKLNNRESTIFLRMIFYPFAVKIIQENDLVASFFMVSMISWWLEKKKVEFPSTNLVNLLLESKYFHHEKIKLDDCKTNKFTIEASETHAKSLKMLIRLFDIKDASSIDCDNLIYLITIILESILAGEKKEVSLKEILKDCSFSQLWKLYFDPLLITHAIGSSSKELHQHIGKEQFIPTDGTQVNIKWSDDRNAMHINEYKRKRVDNIVNLFLKNFEWNERQNMIDNIRWDYIAFKKEHVEFLSKKFNYLISYYFIEYDESIENFALNLKIFLSKIASRGSILLKSTKYFQDFVTNLFERGNMKLLENSEEFIQRFIRNMFETNHNEKQNVKDFEKYLKELYNANATISLNSLDIHLCLVKILSEANPIVLSNVSIGWIVNLIRCLINLTSDELMKNILKVKRILTIIQDTTELPLLKHFIAEIFSAESPDMPMVVNLIKIFNNEPAICLYLKEISNHEIIYFKKSFTNLIMFKTEFGYIEAMAFMSKLANKITETCGYHELEAMQTENFINQLVEVFNDYKEYYSTNLLLAILRLCIRFKNYERDIAKSIAGYLPKFFNDSSLNIEELKIIIEYFYEIDKLLECSSEKFVIKILSALINKIKNCNTEEATKLNETLASIEKCLSEDILMDDLIRNYLKDSIDEMKVEFLSLIKFTHFQEIVLKILFNVIKFEEFEKEILLQKLSLQNPNMKQLNVKQECSNRSKFLLFSSHIEIEDAKLNNQPIQQQDIDDTLRELKNLINRKKMSYIQTNDENKKQIEESVDESLTDLMKDNVIKILDIINDGVPLLIEGPTGVGKSASIAKAAKITKNNENFTRFNMSSRITIEDLMGKLILKKENGVEDFIFEPRPFFVAFKKGYWLLLDELNLAQDVVLQSIENALDNGVLNIYDPTNAIEPRIVVPKHPKFRLFATQNPGSGFFKGKREKLSASFLDRFRIITFESLTRNDLEMIAKSHLKNIDERLLRILIDEIHVKIFDKTNNDSFIEWGPYAEITVRDLLKQLEVIKNVFITGIQSNLHMEGLIYDIANCVYAARFGSRPRRDCTIK